MPLDEGLPEVGVGAWHVPRPRPPRDQRRVRNVVLAFAMYAEEQELDRVGVGM